MKASTLSQLIVAHAAATAVFLTLFRTYSLSSKRANEINTKPAKTKHNGQ
jgi:hypothetical protein